jgi:ubiquinone/menaquinone biosynthesis C-methylase UbiE
VEFYLSLVRRFRAQKVLDLGCGTGRITLPLAEQGAHLDCDVIGLDSQAEMLESAKKRQLEAPPEVRERLRLIQGDMRTWQSESAFDLIVIPCSSISHLLTLQDQLAAWNQCPRNLRPAGRFVVEITMPNTATFADSFNVPPRALARTNEDRRGQVG